MAVQYVRPGTTVRRANAPALAVAIPFQATVGLIGRASNTKGVSDEAIVRAQVADEALTLTDLSGTISAITAAAGVMTLTLPAASLTLAQAAAVIGAHVVLAGVTAPNRSPAAGFEIIHAGTDFLRVTNATAVAEGAPAAATFTILPFATLAVRADNRQSNSTLAQDDVDVTDNAWNFLRSHIIGPDLIAAPVTINDGPTGPNSALCVEIDGEVAMTIVFGTGLVEGVVTVEGQVALIDLVAGTFSANNLVQATLLAGYLSDAISQVLGLEFANCVTAVDVDTVEARLRFASTGVPGGQVSIFPYTAGGVTDGAAAALFGVSDGVSRVEIKRPYFRSTSAYALTYVSPDDYQDLMTLSDTSDPQIQRITAVGSQPRTANFDEGTDYSTFPGSYPDRLDWSGLTNAVFDFGNDAVASFPVTDRYIAVELDRLGSVTLNLVDPGASVVLLALGFSAASPVASLAAAVRNANIRLLSSTLYGARYQAVFSAVSATQVRMTSPLFGEASVVAVHANPAIATAESAMGLFFGTTYATTDDEVAAAAGIRPSPGVTYYASYVADRPASDYTVPKVYFSYDDVLADLGSATADNPLVVAAYIAFRHRAQFIVCVQVDDSATPGIPSRQSYLDALDATTSEDIITDMVLLTDGLSTARIRELQLDLKDHIEVQASETKKRFRIGWCGMPANTAVGTRDTADSFCHRAGRTLQFAPESAGRGRLRLMAPPQLSGLSVDIQQDDGSVARVPLSSEYLGVAAAARRSSVEFGGPAATLATASIVAFNTDDITEVFRVEEVDLMAQNGVMVVSYIDGVFQIVDPVTTEAGGGRVEQYMYDSTMPPADLVSRRIVRAFDTNLKGVVPVDVDDFIFAIKGVVQSILVQSLAESPPTIAPYTNDNGNTRPLDPSSDIRVFRDRNNRRKYKVRYFFNLRYPALEFEVVFSVDNNFALSVG